METLKKYAKILLYKFIVLTTTAEGLLLLLYLAAGIIVGGILF
jgi:hypothetical protein